MTSDVRSYARNECGHYVSGRSVVSSAAVHSEGGNWEGRRRQSEGETRGHRRRRTVEEKEKNYGLVGHSLCLSLLSPFRARRVTEIFSDRGDGRVASKQYHQVLPLLFLPNTIPVLAKHYLWGKFNGSIP